VKDRYRGLLINLYFLFSALGFATPPPSFYEAMDMPAYPAPTPPSENITPRANSLATPSKTGESTVLIVLPKEFFLKLLLDIGHSIKRTQLVRCGLLEEIC